MSFKKLNCWEFKKCGRQPRGARAEEQGVCPAALDERLDGVHDGLYAGRSCWVVSGTFCKGEVQGTFAQKFKSCEQCDFYQTVKAEERMNLTLTAVLLDRMRNR